MYVCTFHREGPFKGLRDWLTHSFPAAKEANEAFLITYTPRLTGWSGVPPTTR